MKARKTTSHCSADIKLQRDQAKKYKFGSILHRSSSWSAEGECREEIGGDRREEDPRERTDGKNNEKDNNSEEGSRGLRIMLLENPNITKKRKTIH